MSYLTRRIAVEIVLLAVAAFFAYQSAFAFTSGDFEYGLDYGNMTAAVTKYKGSATSVAIPSLIDVPEQYKDEDGEWHTRYKVFRL